MTKLLLLALLGTVGLEPLDVEFFEALDDDTNDAEEYHSHDRILNVMLPTVTRLGRTQMVILHRARAPVTENPLRDGLGLDTGLRVGIGLRYGITEGVDVGILRANGLTEPFDIYEFDIRKSHKHNGTTVGVRAGASTFYVAGATSTAWFVQGGLQKSLGGVTLTAMAAFHQNSTGATKTPLDLDHSFGLGAGVEVPVTESMSVAGDVVASLGGYRVVYPGVTVGAKWRSWRHTFALMLTNTDHVTLDGLIANTPRAAPSLGFNVTREF